MDYESISCPNGICIKMSHLSVNPSTRIRIPAYWWRNKLNFGDTITPFLLNRIGSGFNAEIFWAGFADSEIVGAGSILEHGYDEPYTGSILGAGLRHAGSEVNLSSANVCFVRGRLTEKTLGIKCNAVGDPGILISKYISASPKKYDWGVICHFRDDSRKLIERIHHMENVLIIDPMNDVTTVASLISSCRNILSSSLHGLILADSYGIPNQWLRMSQKAEPDFKYFDYFSSVCRKDENAKAITADEPDLLRTPGMSYNEAVRRNMDEIDLAITDYFKTLSLRHTSIENKIRVINARQPFYEKRFLRKLLQYRSGARCYNRLVKILSNFIGSRKKRHLFRESHLFYR